MTTRAEYNKRIEREEKLLDEAWEKQFYSGTPEEGRATFLQDHIHPPVAIANMLDALFEEVLNRITQEVSAHISSGRIAEEDAWSTMFNGAMHIARTTAIRMYRFGQELKDTLPYEKLTACPCGILFDDEVDNLLIAASIDPDLTKEGGET